MVKTWRNRQLKDGDGDAVHDMGDVIEAKIVRECAECRLSSLLHCELKASILHVGR